MAQRLRPKDVNGLPMSRQVEAVEAALLRALDLRFGERLTPLSLCEVVREDGWDPALTSIGFRHLRKRGVLVVDDHLIVAMAK